MDHILVDEAGLGLYSVCRGTPPTTAATFSPQCVMLETDAGSATNGLYSNIGTTAVPSWDLVGSTSAGEITLAEGNMLVGAASGLATALDIGATSAGIAIGNGTTATINALSADATMSTAGAVTVVSSNAAFAVGTTFTTASTTATSGAGAVAITGMIHEVTTTGTGDALTLADGAEGQHLNVVYVAEGAGADTAVCTPSNLAGANTTITFNDLGDAAALLFTAGAWYFVGGEAVIAA